MGIASERIEIVTADDHAMIRSGLRRVLDGEADLSAVAEAVNVDGALDQTLRRRPRIVVLDLNMPGTPTLPPIPRFLGASARTDVVVLTMESDPAMARRAMTAGARGYVLEDAAEVAGNPTFRARFQRECELAASSTSGSGSRASMPPWTS